MTPVLELQDLHVLLCTHRHQGVELVKGVSFSVYPWGVPWNPWGVRKWKIHVYESGDGPFGS